MIIALMQPNLTKVGILIDFKINQDFIAKVLCINREKPMSTCNGKCYLSEQLKKIEKQEEKQAPTSKKERLDIVSYYLAGGVYNFLSLNDNYISKLNSVFVDEFLTSLLITDIFRPPKHNLI